VKHKNHFCFSQPTRLLAISENELDNELEAYRQKNINNQLQSPTPIVIFSKML
jgi:hypothetical protein